MRREYEHHDEDRFAASIAATAFAIHLLEESRRKLREASEIPLSRTKTRKDEPLRPAKSASLKRPSGQENRALSFGKPVASSTSNEQLQRGKISRERKAETKADAWEKAEMEKIKKWYDKLESQILVWENEMKMTTKLQQEKKKAELELSKNRNIQHYNMKLARIDHIAEGARTQAKEKRKHEELVARKRAEKIRAGREAPSVCCSCF